MEVVEKMADLLQEEDLELFATIAKAIWKRCNEVIHGGIFTHPNVIVVESVLSLQQFHKANAKPLEEFVISSAQKPK